MDSTEEQAKQIASFGNGNTRTVVTEEAPGCFHWLRTRGRLRATPLWAAPLPVLHEVSSASTEVLEVVCPETSGDAQLYRMAGPSSVAFLILVEKAEPELFSSLLRETGRVVRRMHDLPLVEGFSSPPTQLAELTAWLETGRGPRDALKLHALAYRQLGEQRWSSLRSWCDELLNDVDGRRLLHGAVGLGQIVPVRGGDRGELLTGTHIGVGSSSFDLGSCLGQLLELHETSQRGFVGRSPDGDYGALAAAFLDGYGALPNPIAVGHAAVLTCLNHVRMFVTYGTWHEDVLLSVELILDLTDDQGRSALRGSSWGSRSLL
jgi:hypothetical protein